MPGTVAVAVIGLGSRGLGVLERIVTLATLAGAAAGDVRVAIVDPTCAGAGVHDTGQPDYLLLNTTADAVSVFPDEHSVGPAVVASGPSLYEWATERDLRVAADGYTVGTTGRPVRRTDFLPRRVLGEYLSWCYDIVRNRAPAWVRLVEHRTEAVDIEATPDGGLTIALANGSTVRAGHAFLTTGYTANQDDRATVAPYPLPARLAGIRAGETVAITGFGLTSMDLVSTLTVGRGGRFKGTGQDLIYVPSGDEPAILLYSRTGLPCRARPRVVEFAPRYEPVVFTPAGIDALRGPDRRPLDFDRDVWPLVLTEMRIAYQRRRADLAGRRPDLERELAAGRLGELLSTKDDVDALFHGSAGMSLADTDSYQEWFASVLRADLAESELGFVGSPVKAALDVLRELRDTFRYVVDFGGLTPRSLDEFTVRTVPAINRAVVGPQFERHTELLALMAAGLVAVPFGPAPVVTGPAADGRWILTSSRLDRPYTATVDRLIGGQVPLPAVATSASRLIGALYAKGWLRRHRPASGYVPGADVDGDQHPIGANGRAERRLWMLGPMCEGATFYNNLVPSPGVYSRPLVDAHRCVAAMFAAAGVSVSTGSACAPAAGRPS